MPDPRQGLLDKITLAWEPADPRFFWTAAHEYWHALHHKALDGLWWQGFGCYGHEIPKPSGHRCALQEGFANYAGTIGSVSVDHPDGYYHNCFEHFGTPKAHRYRCRNVSHDRKPEIEGWVAALFMDLIDGNNERHDWTEYPGRYVARVFKTCMTKSVYDHLPDKWWKRTNVSNIVRCLENYIDRALHKEVFPGIRTPGDVHEWATEPPDWDPLDIRATWLKNLK